MLLIAGRFDLPFFYIVFGCQIAVGIVTSLLIHPDLVAERMRPKGKDKDPAGAALLGLGWFVAFYLAAMDVGHWHVADTVPFAVQVVAVILMTAGWAGMSWSMLSNLFFSSAIRLQDDRGQTVVAAGPYAYIRHPGYAFAAVGFLGQGIALGSWLTVIPFALIIAHLAYRTILEEKLLIPGLPGYREYCEKVPYRWIPRVW